MRLERLVRSAPILIIAGLGLLLAVRAIGVTSNGGRRWLNLHVIYLQPSELFKLFTVLFIAWLVQYHHNELGHWRQLALCLGHDPDLWFPVDSDGGARAVSICTVCPVRLDCLAWAIENNERNGPITAPSRARP